MDENRKIEFSLNGRDAVLICPDQPAPGMPWVWRAEFLGAFDYADRALLARGVSPRTTAMQAIGYKEFFDALEGRSTLSAAADLCKQRSRNYAKRQLTWFRRNPQLCWLRMTGQEDFAQILAAARQNIPFSAL